MRLASPGIYQASSAVLPSRRCEVYISRGAESHAFSWITSLAMALQHVLIIGGGLAGPCLALSLARHGIRSTIFEIRPERSDSGGSISLGPNALQVLDKYAGVYDQVKAAGFTYHSFGAYFEDGERLGAIKVGQKDGYPAVRIMRTTLHKVLLDAGEGMEGKIQVKYGAKFSAIEQGEEGVTVTFEDGSSASGKSRT